MTIRYWMALVVLSLAGVAVTADGAQAWTGDRGVDAQSVVELQALEPVEDQDGVAPGSYAATIGALAPADSLYREARRALTRREYERAISLFAEFRATEPESIHLADARYYEALARFHAVVEELSGPEAERSASAAEVERAATLLGEARALLAESETREPTEETARLQSQVQSVLEEVIRNREALERGDTIPLGFRVDSVRRSVPFTVGRLTRTADPLPYTGASELAVVGDTTLAARLAGARVLSPEVYNAGPGRTALLRPSMASTPFAIARYAPGLVGVMRPEIPNGCDEARLRERMAAFYALFDRDPEILAGLLDELEGAGEADLCAAPLRSTVLAHALATGALDRDRVVHLLRTDPDPFTRRAALHGLQSSADPADMELLAEIATRDDDQNVRLVAAHTLLELPDGAGRDRALELVEGGELESQGVVMIVWEILSDASAEEAARVRALFDRFEDDSLRTAILAQLSVSTREEDRRWVRERVADPDLPVQMRAAALNQASWRGADMEFLLSVYQETEEPLLRQQILWALAGSPSPEATEALIRAYRDSDDDHLRSTAVNALVQRDDERADAALRAILRGEDPR